MRVSIQYTKPTFINQESKSESPFGDTSSFSSTLTNLLLKTPLYLLSISASENPSIYLHSNIWVGLAWISCGFGFDVAA